MKKNIVFILLTATVMLSGCNPNQTTIDFNRPDMERETTTFVPVNEQQHLSGFSQINIAELEGFENITEADIFIPIPNEAVWDANTKTFTLPNNNENENGESFVVTISLEHLPEEISFTEMQYSVKEEVEELQKSNRAKYSGSWHRSEENVVVKVIKETILEEPPEDGETTEALKKTVSLDITAYDFLVPSYALSVKIEIVKQRGTVDETAENYISAVSTAVEKLKYHFQDN